MLTRTANDPIRMTRAPGHSPIGPDPDALRARAPHQPTDEPVHEALHRLPAAVAVRRFSLWYGAAQALHDITMPIPRGKVTALIGPSGCGKSTLLRSINRMNDLVDGVRVSGSLHVGDDDAYARGADVISIRRRVGMVFQRSNPFPMSIFDNVVYGLRIHGERRKDVLHDACERALRAAALWDDVRHRLKHSAMGLSGGQQQRLCIARSIAVEPEVLLMDEPCSALDPIATQKIEDLVRAIAQNITVVIVTHNMQQAARVSHFTAFMYLGRLVELGPTSEIFQNPRRPQTEQYVTGRFG